MHPSPALVTFLYGVMGSVSVELIKILSYYQAGARLPVRYGLFGYWVARVLLALIGGGLAVAYGVTTPIVAVHIGASAPALIETFARTPPKQ